MSMSSNEDPDPAFVQEIGQQFVAGRGETLQAAFDDAWERAKRAGKSGRFTVSIEVVGTNPLSEYRVILSQTS
jgi:hypothetical protein